MTPERDIAERLLTGEPCLEANGRPCRSMDAQSGCACAEAAAEITRLRTALADAEANLVKARDALKPWAEIGARQDEWMLALPDDARLGVSPLMSDFRNAAATLKSLTDT